MSEWRKVKLGDVVNVSTGYSFKGNLYEFSGSLRVVRGENITEGTLRWDSEKFWNHSFDEKYLLEINDIVIGMDGSKVGKNRAKIQKNELPLILAQRVAKIKATELSSQDFIWYTLYNNNFVSYVESVHTGTSIPHISLKQISDFQIPFPPLKEQKAIAEVLSSLDDKIDLLHRQNKTLEALAQTLFRQWFIEEAGDDWEECKLSDLLEIKYGKDHKKLADGNIPVYGSGGIMRYADSFLYDQESILIPRKGTLTNLFYIDEPFWTVDTIFWSKVNTEKVSGKFLFSFLKTMDLSNLNVGSAVPSLTTKVLNEIKILLPSLEEQKKFNEYADNAWIKIKSNLQQIKTLEDMRDTLLPKLMSGEVRVNL